MARMARLGSRWMDRSSGSRTPPHGQVALVPWVLVGVSIAFLVIGRVEPGAFHALRGLLVGWSAPSLAFIATLNAPLNQAMTRIKMGVGDLHQVENLRAENGRLAAMAAHTHDLERENAELKRIAGFASGPASARVTARVVTRSSGSLSATILINAGRNQGVKDGYPVLGSYGLIGRVVQVVDDYAIVLLLQDPLSRVPVQIGASHVRAVAVGTGGVDLKLDFVGGDGQIAAGDSVVTSGLGGVFPRGLFVGLTVGEASGWRLSPTADGDGVFTVSVLQFEPPTLGSKASPGVTRRQAVIGQPGDGIK